MLYLLFSCKTRWAFSLLLVLALLASFGGTFVVTSGECHANGDTTLTLNINYPPDGAEICYCSNFNAGVTITNTGLTNALNVITWIEIIGNASLINGETVQKGPVELGTDTGTENWFPTWTLHCDGAGDVTIVIHTRADNAPEQTDTVTITQLKPHLVVDITTPPDGTAYEPGSTFNVIAQVQNTGTLLAQYVSLTATTTGPAATSDNVTQSATPQNINPGETATAQWSFHCESQGEVTITINAAGWYYCESEVEGSTVEHSEGARFGNLTPIPDDNIEPATITVYQGSPALTVTFNSPVNGSTVKPGSYFCVITHATNNGLSTAYGSTLTIDINGPASTAYALTQVSHPPDIGAGESGCAAWQVRCEGTGDVIITVASAGYVDNAQTTAIPDANLTSQTITIHQIKPEGTVTSFSSPSNPASEQMTPIGTSPSVLNIYVRPEQVAANRPITIYSNIANRGDLPDVYRATLKINGEVEQVKEGILEPHTATPLEFVVYRSEPGIYNVDINGKIAYFKVVNENARIERASLPLTSRGLLIIIITMVFIVTVMAAVVVFRRLA
jgi:hypothetical protein